ncbi:MAG: hypothetical protein A2Z48_01740 [Actinobacteria bacterium RBG_19FT_COMBO_70_19]|nr:MAG: hypothetical protein A2Z48_01740 [Actinobacteria bacterium RBG_19FT_COMBO_70_19]
MSPAFIAIGVTVVVVAVAGTVVALTDDGPMRGAVRRPLPVPAPWIVIGAVLLVIGVLVMPKLLGFTFLLLPMIWSRRARRPRGPSGPGHDRDRDPYDEDR